MHDRLPGFDRFVAACLSQALPQFVLDITCRHVEHPRVVQPFRVAEYSRVVTVVLMGSRVEVGRLHAVGPVAKVVDLFPFRYLPSCLYVGQPVCLLLLPADPLDPVAALIQGVFPHHAVSPWHEWKVDRYGYAQAVLWDYTGPWASVGPRVEGLGVVPVPPPEDRVSLHLVVPWHCCAPRFTRSILAGAFGKALSRWPRRNDDRVNRPLAFTSRPAAELIHLPATVPAFVRCSGPRPAWAAAPR